ncbi:pseudouridine synthase [Halotalea alkalilenta]|uniref:pseudouridine synthase n=1 Tax=Halotalea alkalilenta TaxID=376489 RepID=UPI0005B7DF03|nr:16S rRNA pseudouridine(516) synthase [Halotalea alkalilenta]
MERLDRVIIALPEQSRQRARRALLEGRIRVNRTVERDGTRMLTAFDRVEFDDRLLRPGRTPRYLMLYKPGGCISATRDDRHPTALELLGADASEDLHIAGRLDYHTTGLLLLTNDSAWSERLTQPGSRKPKRYCVDLARPLHQRDVEAFATGIRLRHETIDTLPAILEIEHAHRAWVTLFEGRYRQIRRMFATLGNHVVALHRERVGGIVLDPGLSPGEYRPLERDEIAAA